MASSKGSNHRKPNILIIFGDDIGQANLSAYSHGMMGYKTPNIDRIAREGMLFTDYYGEQSCTAGRAAFLLGQSVFRSGTASQPALAAAPAPGREPAPTVRWRGGSPRGLRCSPRPPPGRRLACGRAGRRPIAGAGRARGAASYAHRTL
jgi:hypothetical protein